MSNRTFEAVFQQLKDGLRDYEYMDAPATYEHITEHGDDPFQEYARYTLTKSDKRVPADETGISQRCRELKDKIRQHDDVEYIKTIFGSRITMEVYTAYNGDE